MSFCTLQKRKLSIVLILIILISAFNIVHVAQVEAVDTLEIITLGNTGWNDSSVGTWDLTTLTGTLTRDIYGSIEIISSGVTLEGGGYTLRGDGTSWGVKKQYGSEITVRNLIIDSYEYGIFFNEVPSNFLIEDNTITNTVRGIYLNKSSEGSIIGNDISSSSYAGITLNFTYAIEVIANRIHQNEMGIALLAGKSSTIRENTISGHNVVGVFLSRSWDGFGWGVSTENVTYHNNFIDNATHAYRIYASDEDNLFNLALPDGGNYWSGHSAVDDNDDGIVDVPYTFTGGHDDFPYVIPSGWYVCQIIHLSLLPWLQR
jgi:parallel beta-helix repeat protein